MSKQLRILWAAAVILLAVVFFTVNPFQDQVRKDNPKGGPLFNLDPDRVDGFSIKTPDTINELVKKDGAWLVASKNDYPADTSLVGRILRALDQADRSQLASRNPDMYETLEVTPDLGVTVTVSQDGKDAASFIVGKSSREYASSYLSLEGEPEVYLLNPMNKALFIPTRGFRDRRILQFDGDQLRKLEWAAADTGWVLVHADSVWTVESPDGTQGTAVPAQVKALTRLASGLMASGFVDSDSVETGLDHPDYQITAWLDDGTEARVLIGDQGPDGGYYTAVPDKAQRFIVSEWTLKQFGKRAAELIQKN